MADMLVKLFELDDDWSFIEQQKQLGISIRKPLGPEVNAVISWVRENFSDAWSSEASIAAHNMPKSCFVAIKDGKPIGFACYDATSLGFFGPIGVGESCRGKGTGKALLLACMLDMKLKGYQYAVIAFTSKYEFYNKLVGATVIPDSEPGVWQNWINTL